LLHSRFRGGSPRLSEHESQSRPGADPERSGWKHLPLRDLRRGRAGRAGTGQERRREIMAERKHSWGPREENVLIGKSIPRIDAAEKASGKAKYTADIN